MGLNVVLTVGMIIYLVIIFLIAFLFKSEMIANRFKKVLRKAIKYKTLDSIEDVYTLYKGVYNSDINSNSNYRQGLGRILREMLAETQNSLGKKRSNEEELLMLIKELKNIIKENDEITPFSDLPLQERNVISDAMAFLKHDDKESVENKINELATFLILANDRKIKSDKKTHFSYILAIVSTVITVISFFKN